MKKILALLLAFAMMLPCFSFAEDDLTGEWYADLFGMTVTLTLYDDATYQMDVAGDLTSGAWVQNGDLIIVEPGTAEEAQLQYDAYTPSLSMIIEGLEFIFTREAPETYVPAAPLATATLDDMQGVWEAAWVSMYGMMLDTYSAGMEIYVALNGAEATLYSHDGFGEYDIITLPATFADGTMTVIEPAEDEYSEDLVYRFSLLEDGMMVCESEYAGDLMVIYLEESDPLFLPQPSVPADPADMIGVWYSESYTMTINEDGTATIVDSYGDTEYYTWTLSGKCGLLEGDGFFTGSEFLLESDGTLNLAYWVSMTRDPYVAPEPYDITLLLGDWVEADGSVFTVNDDFTAVYFAIDGTKMSMEWENGTEPLITTGDWWLGTLTVNESGMLVMDDGFTHKEFSRPAPVVEEPATPEVPVIELPGTEVPVAGGVAVSVSDPSTYLEKNFMCVSLIQGDILFDMAYVPVSSIVFHENGLADVTIMGMLTADQPYMAGNMGGVDTFMVTYMDYLQLLYTVGDTGLDLNYIDMMDMHFEIR